MLVENPVCRRTRAANTQLQEAVVVAQIAEETAGSVRHRKKAPLSGKHYDHNQLKEWLHQWVKTRHVDGTERTLLTGLNSSDSDLADLVFSVASERLYADGGHLLDSATGQTDK